MSSMANPRALSASYRLLKIWANRQRNIISPARSTEELKPQTAIKSSKNGMQRKLASLRRSFIARNIPPSSAQNRETWKPETAIRWTRPESLKSSSTVRSR